MGGSKSGTALSSLNRALKDGIMQKGTMAAFEEIGLIDPSKVRTFKGAGAHGNGASAGGGVSFMPGALANEEQFRKDPAAWVWGTLIPKLNAAGIVGSDAQVNWIQHSKLTTNPTRILSELIRNRGVDQTEAANVRMAAGVSQYAKIMETDPGANAKAKHDAFNDMKTAFGAPLVKPAITAMQAMTGVAKGIASWAAVHPKTVRVIGEAVVALGAALVGLGVVAVGVAAVAAIASGGLVAVVVMGRESS
jgi:hypothetical protein